MTDSSTRALALIPLAAFPDAALLLAGRFDVEGGVAPSGSSGADPAPAQDREALSDGGGLWRLDVRPDLEDPVPIRFRREGSAPA